MTERRRVTSGFDLETRAPDTPASTTRARRPIEAIGRPIPAFDVLPPRRRDRGDDRDNFATGLRNSWVAFWTQLWTVGRWCAAASAALFLAVGAWLGQPWGWVAGALPLVVLALWLASVLAQGRRHMRGQAGPPPGWIGHL